MRKAFSMTLAALLGCGLMAGLFFVFSVCIMTALAQLPPANGIAAMQSINIVIVNPVFLVVFLGTAVACVWSLVSALLHWDAPGSRYLLGGSLCYLVGALLVTAIFNIPLNNTLAAANPADSASASLWASYVATWTPWNHVRTVASLVATLCFALAFAQST